MKAVILAGGLGTRISEESALRPKPMIEIGGIIRRLDVAADNTIMSEQVAEARVSYSGTGPMTNSTRRRGFNGWLHRVLDWVWPF